MKTKGRSLLQASAYCLAALCLIGLLVHTSRFKDAARQFIIKSLDDRLGGSSSVEHLDYRLWLGEIRGFGFAWSSAGEGVSVRVDELVLSFSPWSTTSVMVCSPEVRVRPGDSETGAPLRLPAGLFGIAVEVTDGLLILGDLELEDIESRVVPHDGSWEGSLATGRARLTARERFPVLDAVSARLRIGPTSAEVTDFRVEKGASYGTGTIRIESFAPLLAEASLTHTIEGSLVHEMMPEVVVDDPIVGEARFRRENDSWLGEGVLEATSVTFATSQAIGLRAPWRLEGELLFIEDAELSGYDGQARLSAKLDFGTAATGTQEIDVSFDGLEVHPRLGSDVRGTASVTFQGWDVRRGRGHATLDLRPDRTLSGVALRGRVKVDVDGPAVTVHAPHIEGPGFELEALGEIGERLSFHYAAVVEDFRALRLVPSSLGLTGSGRVDGRVEGTFAKPRATAEISTTGLGVAGVSLEAEARLLLTERRIELSALSVRHESGGALALAGAFDLESETLSLRGKGEDFALHEARDLEALISSIQVEIDGPLQALRGTASAEIGSVRFKGVALPGAAVRVEVDGGAARLVANANGEMIVSARMAIQPPFATEAEIRLHPFPLGELLRTIPDYEDAELEVKFNRLNGRLLASVELSDPSSFRYRLEAEEVVGSYRGVGFGVSSPFALDGNLDAVTVHDLTLIGDDTAIGIEGVLPLSSSGVVDLHARGVARLELLSFWAPEAGLEGRVVLELRASGALPNPELHGDIEISDARALIRDLRVDDVRVRARFQGASVVLEELTGELLGGRFGVDGEIPFREGGDAEARLRFHVDDIELSTLAPVVDGAQPQLKVRVSASGEVTGATPIDLVNWRGRGVIDSASASASVGVGVGVGPSLGGDVLTSAEAVSWTLEDGVVRLSELRLLGADTDLVLAGDIKPLAEPLEWNARASGRIDPRFLAPTLAELGMALTGEMDLDLRASQSREPLDIEGTVSLDNGRLSVREPALAFTNLTGNLEIRNQTLKLTGVGANVGGGSAHAEGEIQLVGYSVSALDLRGRARSLRLSYPEGFRSEMDGAIRLLGSRTDLKLSGDITLARAIFSRDINLQTELLESLSRAREPETPDSFANRIGLDVRIRTREGLRIDNNVAKMDASASLVLGGTIAEPEIAGAVSAREGGAFRFGRNTYRIQSGQIELRRYPIEPPELDVTARTTVSHYDIRLSVRGPTDNLTTDLSGTSRRDGRALTAPDAASLLVTGRTIKSVSTEGRAILGEQMTSYLGASLADLAQFGLGGALPFDIVTVEPSLIAGEDDPVARFTLGAAVNESLSVVYSVGLTDAEKQIWIVDYKLPRRTRTQLIRQEDNELTFAFGQQLQFDRSASSRRANDARVHISRVGFYFVTGEPGDLETEARDRLGIEVGQGYDYWKAWERAERLRSWLRDRGFLEATADLSATPCGPGCVEIDVFVATGKRVRFVWSGDELEDSLKQSLAAVLDGYMTPSFLASDLSSIAEGLLFARRYYLANVDVLVEDGLDETVVSVRVGRGPRGASVDVELTGRESILGETLLAALPKPSTTEFHELLTSKRPRLQQILEVRYASLGYLQAEIGDPVRSFDAESAVLVVTIPVVEGPASVVGRVELEGVEGIKESVARSRLALREGEPFRLSQFVQDRSTLAAYYREQGYPDVEVDSAIVAGDEPGSIVARYVVREGPEVTVRDIRVTGNDSTRESWIRREVVLKPGEPLRLSDVSATQKRLYELGIFRSADVVVSKPEDDTDGTVRDVVVEVAEVPDVTLDYGVRFTTDGLFQVVADVGVPNVFGRAQRVGFRTLIGTDERIFRFTYSTPYVARYKLNTDFFLERRVEEEVPEGVPFTARDWRFTAQQSRPVKERLTLQWSYSFKQTEVELDDPIFGPVAISQKQSIFTTALIGDYRDSVVDPSRGSLWSVTLQGAPKFFGSDFKFIKAFAQAYTFVGLGRHLVWAGGYRVGAIDNLGQTLLRDDRFQAGGANSVRGFELDSLGPPLGGEGVLIFNQEIRFPVFWKLHGVGFYDAGNVFAKPSDIRLSELRQNVGAGLRLVLPFGLIRFDWARILDVREGEDPWRFVFSLGHAF